MSTGSVIGDRWARVRDTTVRFFEQLDDDSRGLRLSEGTRSIEELSRHILAAEISVIEGVESGVFEWTEKSDEVARLSWRELIEHAQSLPRRFSVIEPRDEQWFETCAPNSPLSRAEWLWQTIEHEIHHRAQISSILRASGLVPPKLYE